MPENKKRKILAAFAALAVLAAALVCVYLFGGMSAENWDYNFARRMRVLGAVAVVGVSVGLSSTVFQTITSNYILTPQIMGLDSLYIFIQASIIWFFGSGANGMMTSVWQFALTLALMASASICVFYAVFKINGGDIYFAVLAGMVLGISFSGLASFMEVVIDPSEFSILEGRMFASFNKINTPLLGASSAAAGLASICIILDFRNLDAITLGRAQSVALGVDYNRVVLRTLAGVSILSAASTALVGPVAFLGIVIVSVARFVFPTYRHCVLAPASALVGVCVLIFALIITERCLQFSVPIGVVINLAGGLYFLYLVLRLKRI